MTTHYAFETQLVVNPAAPNVILTDALVTIYDAADTAMSTPLELLDATGLPLANPVQIGGPGLLPAFQATSPQVLWSGGGYTGYLNSFKGVLASAQAAQAAAEAAAEEAALAGSGGPHTHNAVDLVAGTLDPARLPAATTAAQGAMPAADKAKLDNATSVSIADRLVLRDTNGRASVADPAAATDVATKGYVDSVAGTGGTIPDRLGATAKVVTDWNLATDNGYYQSADTASNKPTGATGNLLATVIATATTVTQTLFEENNDGSADTKMWRRDMQSATWSAWYRVRLSQAELDSRYAAGSFSEIHVRLLDTEANAETNRAAIQAAMENLKITGGTITLVPPGGPAYLASNAAFVSDRITHYSRIRVRSSAPNGVNIKAVANIPGDIWCCGATDGTDSNWHYGTLEGVQFDGNKANNSQNAAINISSVVYETFTGIPTVAAGLTVTTAAAHGYRRGDIIKFSGTSAVGLVGEWAVLEVPTTTTFRITVNGASTMNGSTGGTVRRLKNCVSVLRGGETSAVSQVQVNNAADHGFYYGIQGVPMLMDNLSAFYNMGYGYSVWPDRPLTMIQPSGDGNTLGLIAVQGSQGVATGQSALTVLNMKAEFLSVPAVLFSHWDGSAVFISGAVEMNSGNTAPPFRRIGTSNGRIKFYNTRVDMKNTVTATVFDDQGNAAYSRTTSHIYAFSYTDDIGPDTQLRMERWDYLGGTDPTPYIDNASTWWYAVDSATVRTIQAPTSYVPQFSKDVQTITILVQNTTAGAITVNFVSNFKVEGWTAPAAGKAKLITFKHINGVTGTNWYCQSISPDFTP